jgi:hypothetical protein
MKRPPPDESHESQGAQAERAKRLAAALKANLHRRKAQTRGRAAHDASGPEAASGPADSAGSKSGGAGD